MTETLTNEIQYTNKKGNTFDIDFVDATSKVIVTESAGRKFYINKSIWDNPRGARIEAIYRTFSQWSFEQFYTAVKKVTKIPDTTRLKRSILLKEVYTRSMDPVPEHDGMTIIDSVKILDDTLARYPNNWILPKASSKHYKYLGSQFPVWRSEEEKDNGMKKCKNPFAENSIKRFQR